MTQAAVLKITDGMKDNDNNKVPAEPIAEFLKKKCGEDGEFAALVTQAHKTLAKCLNFVHEQAKKHLNNCSGWIGDDEVYAMAADYFIMDDAEIERKKAEDQAKREEEARIRREESQRKAEEAKTQKAREARQTAEAAKLDKDQLSLFE